MDNSSPVLSTLSETEVKFDLPQVSSINQEPSPQTLKYNDLDQQLTAVNVTNAKTDKGEASSKELVPPTDSPSLEPSTSQKEEPTSPRPARERRRPSSLSDFQDDLKKQHPKPSAWALRRKKREGEEMRDDMTTSDASSSASSLPGIEVTAPTSEEREEVNTNSKKQNKKEKRHDEKQSLHGLSEVADQVKLEPSKSNSEESMNIDEPMNDTTEGRLEGLHELRAEISSVKITQQKILQELGNSVQFTHRVFGQLEQATKQIEELASLKANLEQDLAALRQEVTNFAKEKEELRKMVGTAKTPQASPSSTPTTTSTPMSATFTLPRHKATTPAPSYSDKKLGRPPKRKLSIENLPLTSSDEESRKPKKTKTPKKLGPKKKDKPDAPLPATPVAEPTLIPSIVIEERPDLVVQEPKMQECYKILLAMRRHRFGWVFNQPVDPVALNIPDYFTIITNPMDFSTIQKKMEDQSCSTPEQFVDLMNLVFKNATVYNPPGSEVHRWAQTLQAIFERKMRHIVNIPKEEPVPLEPITPTAGETPEYVPPVQQPVQPVQPVPVPAKPSALKEFKEEADFTLKQIRSSVQQAKEVIEGLKNKPSGESSAKIVTTTDSQELTYDEKCSLTHSIATLSDEQQVHIIEIISRRRMPQLSSTSGEVEVDLDNLDNATLREIQRYVNSMLSQTQPKQNASKKAKAAKPKRKGKDDESSTSSEDSGSSSSDSSDSEDENSEVKID